MKKESRATDIMKQELRTSEYIYTYEKAGETRMSSESLLNFFLEQDEIDHGHVTHDRVDAEIEPGSLHQSRSWACRLFFFFFRHFCLS